MTASIRGRRRRLVCLGATPVLALVAATVRCSPHGDGAEPDRTPGRVNEEDVEALLRDADELVKQGRLAPARDILNRALELAPDNRDARLAYASVLRRLGRPDAARAQLLRVLELDHDHLKATVTLGYLERQAGRLDESVRWFRRGAAIDGGWYNHVRLLVSFADLGDLDAAAQAARGLAESPLGDGFGAGLLRLYRADFAAARVIFERELARTDMAEFRYLAAAAAVQAGAFDEALAHYRVLSPELFADEPELRRTVTNNAFSVAYALAESGQRRRATRLLRRLLELYAEQPGRYDSVHMKINRMKAHALLGEERPALAALRAAIDQGYRSVLLDRIVYYEHTSMFASLHDDPDFQAMMAEIRAANARMLARVRTSP